MKAISKTMLGAGVAALAAVSFAAPAEARHRDRHDGIDAGDIITGVAIIGGIAAVASALGRDGNRYGYGYRDRYRSGYNYAVQSCAQEAQRMGRGRVHITDVDRTGNDRYRVRGIVEAGYGGGYGYDRRDRDYGGYDRGYGRGYGRDGRDDFTCVARGNGRITDFRL
ncbi:MAG TPA: hypothetical protein VFZ91_08200 [Allosphingosinicella sp.]